ncbi:RIP metalloprotease RseP [Seohaeicola sp. SP36]|uniref:RIP metalloprotease RseP n=1 Tax=unclassified Seohaeicola TaxID=2641111 RepID=UPI00237C42A4|nr:MULTISPECIES: RIP metalloprotease RseP [unclassified Seohaeicola]MDD9707248.1 RIP metalloprotease RseP [Seohaeicola sp. 4SK31]MDD9735489.1 RIP metalloprotease RseP [Seohaeicola sp. SP36]
MDIASLLPQFGSLAMTLAAFVVALSVIVAVHEYGHYIVGRWSGIHADVFSLGFGPVIYASHDKRGTKWQVALLPFGGFVKFRGDADAASAGVDGEAIREMTPAERRSTMSGAPLWARTATVAAGPIFNFVLAIVVFTAIGLTRGVAVEPLTVGELRPVAVAHEVMPGDVILAIDGQTLPQMSEAGFGALTDSLPAVPLLEYQVLRDGQEVTVQGPHPMPPVITQLAPQSAAIAIDLRADDVIVAVDGDPIHAFRELREKVMAAEGAPLQLDVLRDGQALQFTLTPRRVDEPQAGGGFETNWRIGIIGGLFFDPMTESPGLVEALVNGVSSMWEIIVGSISGLYHMITGAISTCNMSGPIGIAEVSGAMASQGTVNFIYFIAVLSTAVGLLNLFPIPVLDGGHLVFYAYEAVAGKPPSDKVLRVLMGIGLTLILSLMVFALGNDIFCP